ncbi:MAG: DUF1932 domain-containing protein [Dehalococcoidia bacterium]
MSTRLARPSVAIMSPGDMGHAVGAVLREGGLQVITCLQGRSSRTAALTAEVGIEELPDIETLVRDADILLSILPPARARGLAMETTAAVRRTQATLLYVDCNAVAPATVKEVGALLESAGVGFVDAGIIGPPPQPGSTATRIYASGIRVGEFAQLSQYGLDIRVIGAEIGQASGLKMCYAALTKGLTALATELLVAGKSIGLTEPLRAELQLSQAMLLNWIERQMPGMPPKAYRWVGEMEEIAATFGAVGLTPRIFEGAADLYRFVEATSLGSTRPDSGAQSTTVEEVVAVLSQAAIKQ